MGTRKKTNDNSTPTQGFEVEAGQDNPEIQVEDAVMADDNEVEESTMPYTNIQLAAKPINVPSTFTIPVLKVETVLTVEEIIKIIEEDSKLTINGHLDKTNYDLAKKRKSFYLKARTGLVAAVKDKIKTPAKAWLDQLDENVASITAKLIEGEALMDGKIKEQELAVQLEAERKEKEQQDRIQGRVSGLINLGAVFNEEGYYTFPHAPALIINSVQLKEWEENDYQDFIDQAVEVWNTEQVRIQREEAADQAEKEKTVALAAQSLKLRHKVLRLLGVSGENGSWTLKDGTVLADEFIANLDEAEWDQLTDEIETPPVVDTPADHTEEYKGQTADDDLETTSEEAIASFSGEQPPIHEAYAPQTSGFEIEGETAATSDFEEVGSDDDIRFELLFKKRTPFINHHFLSTTLRLFLPEFEMEANDGVAPTDLKDAGPFGDTGLQYILLKRPK